MVPIRKGSGPQSDEDAALRWLLGTERGEKTDLSEASGDTGRAQMERRLIEKMEDESFRRRLVEDPKGTVEQELGTPLPEGVRVVTVEETQDTTYLVLPATPMAGREGEELSDRELQSVAGGWDYYTMGLICTSDEQCQA